MAILLRLLACALVVVAAHADEPPLVVGAVVSQTGGLADLAAGYGKALLLWQDQVNSAGGLAGRRVQLRLLDDESDAVRDRALYERLIGEEGAQLLIGPYGSAATMLAGAVAERAHRVLVNGAGPASPVQRRTSRYVFQVPAPYAAYGEAAVRTAHEAGFTKLFIVAAGEVVATEMGEGASGEARRLGLPGDVEGFSAKPEAADALVAKARSLGAEAWIVFGAPRDAAEVVKSFRRQDYSPRFFLASAAGDPRFIAAVGQDAEFTLGEDPYQPGVATPGNAAFAKAFEARWGSAPGAAAAQGYAAGQVLAAAVQRAGLDQEKLREALAGLEVPTVLGEYRVDAESGAQIGIVPLVVQIIGGRPRVLRPARYATAKALLPYPAWRQRKVLR